MTTSFITTAIPYVNARPHLGFAYELVVADVLARHQRRRGCDVRFVTGTDDNSLKNVVAAQREGVTPRELVDRNAAAFAALGPLLGVETDDFIRTSSDPRHLAAVDWLWRACSAAGDLYVQRWQGRYCAGCEAFVDGTAPPFGGAAGQGQAPPVDDDVAICAEHGTAPEPVSEPNWFFRLARWRTPIRDAIVSGRLEIVPDAARAEILGFLDGEVRDLSVSRIATRSSGWGIPVPDDPSQVIYVWFDALANYLAALGLGGRDRTSLDHYWRDGQTTHVIGKGITRFHAAYWPAFLLSAGLPLPDRIFVHGYLTVDGEKISKSARPSLQGVGHPCFAGRPIDRSSSGHVEVAPVVESVGADALRWYFARRCRTRSDSDVSIAAICDAYDGDLSDRLGNLVQRCSALAAKLCAGCVPESIDTPAATELRACAEALPARIDAALAAFLLDDAAAAIIDALDAANRYLEQIAPWRLQRSDPAAAAGALYAPLELARFVAGELSPFVPGVARTIAAALGTTELAPVWGLLRAGQPLRIGPPPLPRKGAVRGVPGTPAIRR